jgi:hypothetical protein
MIKDSECFNLQIPSVPEQAVFGQFSFSFHGFSPKLSLCVKTLTNRNKKRARMAFTGQPRRIGDSPMESATSLTVIPNVESGGAASNPPPSDPALPPQRMNLDDDIQDLVKQTSHLDPFAIPVDSKRHEKRKIKHDGVVLDFTFSHRRNELRRGKRDFRAAIKKSIQFHLDKIDEHRDAILDLQNKLRDGNGVFRERDSRLI